MITDADVLTAIRRSDRALAEQLSEWESLDFGVAYYSKAFPNLAEANQLRDVWLADVDGEMAFARCEEFYKARGLECRAWSPASGQNIGPVESLLNGKGWQPNSYLAMGLVNRAALSIAADPHIRVLPARAMRKAYRA